MTEIVLMGISGKVLIFLIQKFSKNFDIKSKFWNGLISCQLCSGFWVFLLLSLTLQVYLFSDLFFFPVVSAIMTAGLMTFTVYLLSLGFNEYFGGKIYVVE